MKVFEFYKKMIARFEAADVSEPHLSASWLLSAALKIKHGALLLKYHDEMTEIQIQTASEYIKRRCRHEPVQYILGEWEFGMYKISVGEGALIPRPETEEWVSKLVSILEIRLGKERRWNFADIGTGSGAIGLTLAAHFPNAYGWLTDISPKALVWAKTNFSGFLGNSEKVALVRGDGAAFLKSGAFDVIVSNPPYISHDELPALMPDVKNWEPLIALDGGNDGVDIYRRLMPNALHALKRGGILAMEHGYKQRQELLAAAPPEFTVLEILNDTADLPRCVIWERT